MLKRISTLPIALLLIVLLLSFGGTGIASAHNFSPSSISTNIRCSGALSGNWTSVSDESPCGSSWNVTTPTSAFVDYHMGTDTSTFNNVDLDVFITHAATANVNYDIYVGSTLIKACPFNQNVPTRWYHLVCNFSLHSSGQQVTIHERTGQVTPGSIMSSAAIQLIISN